MGSDSSCMRQGELCHDRCMDLLLAECMHDIGAARSGARGAFVQAPYLSSGFGDLRDGRFMLVSATKIPLYFFSVFDANSNNYNSSMLSELS